MKELVKYKYYFKCYGNYFCLFLPIGYVSLAYINFLTKLLMGHYYATLLVGRIKGALTFVALYCAQRTFLCLKRYGKRKRGR